MLAVWGVVLGLIFGAIMNIWFWPFLAGGAAVQPGLAARHGMWSALRNYLVFYVATSLWWDLARRSATRC